MADVFLLVGIFGLGGLIGVVTLASVDTMNKPRGKHEQPTNQRTKETKMETTECRNVIAHALAEIFGYENSIPLRAIVASSTRYQSLIAMASNPALYNRLKTALAKVVSNPNTRASF